MPDRIGALSLAISLVAAPASAALPGRADSADLLRLAAYGQGPIEIGGPAGDTAAGAADAHAYGPATCDERFSARRIQDPRAGLDIHVPDGARWLDVIIRPVHQLRELSVTLDGARIGSQVLTARWQRVRLPLIDIAAGPHRIELMLTATGTPLATDGGVAPSVLGMLHAVVVSSATRGPESSLAGPLFEGDTVWLEAGTSLRVPVQTGLGGALETSGVRGRGTTDGLTVIVERESAEGAVEPLLEWPAALQIPWNLLLTRGSARAPYWLTIRVKGDASGAIGLVAPRLTVPTGAAAPRAVVKPASRTVLVAVAGLRADDAEAVGLALPGATPLTGLWSTAPDSRTALVSLLTGRYPDAHGVIARTDRLRSGLQAIGWAATRAGRKAIARLGNLPIADDDKLWEGWSDVRSSADGGFRGLASEVLAATATDLAAAGDEPILAVAVLTDPLPPLMPRAGAAWERYWPSDAGEPPWPAGETRARLAALATKGTPLTEPQRRWVRALRRGKVDETLHALAEFVERLTGAPEAPATRIVIVGLGGADPDATVGLDLESVRVPGWVVGVPLTAAAAANTSDLTDIAALTAGLAQIPGVPSVQGASPLDGSDAAWRGVAFASRARTWDLATANDLALVSDRLSGKSSIYERDQAGHWQPTAAVSAPRRLPFALLTAQLEGWRGASGTWQERTHDPAAHPHGPDDGRSCPR